MAENQWVPPLENNMEPGYHQIEKEDDIPQTSIFGFHVIFLACNWGNWPPEVELYIQYSNPTLLIGRNFFCGLQK